MPRHTVHTLVAQGLYCRGENGSFRAIKAVHTGQLKCLPLECLPCLVAIICEATHMVKGVLWKSETMLLAYIVPHRAS